MYAEICWFAAVSYTMDSFCPSRKEKVTYKKLLYHFCWSAVGLPPVPWWISIQPCGLLVVSWTGSLRNIHSLKSGRKIVSAVALVSSLYADFSLPHFFKLGQFCSFQKKEKTCFYFKCLTLRFSYRKRKKKNTVLCFYHITLVWTLLL